MYVIECHHYNNKEQWRLFRIFTFAWVFHLAANSTSQVLIAFMMSFMTLSDPISYIFSDILFSKISGLYHKTVLLSIFSIASFSRVFFLPSWGCVSRCLVGNIFLLFSCGILSFYRKYFASFKQVVFFFLYPCGWYFAHYMKICYQSIVAYDV